METTTHICPNIFWVGELKTFKSRAMQSKWFTKCVDKFRASSNSFVEKYIEVEGMKWREDILTPDMEYSDIFLKRSI